MKLNIIFSFRNEEENILELVSRVSKALGNLSDFSYEMIFINDCSTDRSLDLLINLQKSFPIKIINTSRRFGGTACVFAGFDHADGDAVVYMDADLQDPPELILELLSKYYQGADIVHATRLSRAGESLFKLFLTKCAYRIINYLSDINLPVDTGDFKLISSKVLKKILELNEYDPYLRGLTIWVGYKQDFIYYNRDARFGGTAKYPLLRSLNPAKEFIRAITSFSVAPLYAAIFLGIISILISFLLIIWTLIAKYSGDAIPGSSGIIISIAFFSGIIILTNGMIGLYVARINNSIKGRPKYIIKDILENNNKLTHLDDDHIKVKVSPHETL